MDVVGSEPVDVVSSEPDQPVNEEQETESVDLYDPNNWKSINQILIDLLVEKGPIRVEMEDSEYPRDDSDKKHIILAACQMNRSKTENG